MGNQLFKNYPPKTIAKRYWGGASTDRKNMMGNVPRSQETAIKAVAFLASDPVRIRAFLQLTGLRPDIVIDANRLLARVGEGGGR